MTEIRAVREGIAARFNYDVEALGECYRRREGELKAEGWTSEEPRADGRRLTDRAPAGLRRLVRAGRGQAGPRCQGGVTAGR